MVKQPNGEFSKVVYPSSACSTQELCQQSMVNFGFFAQKFAKLPKLAKYRRK